MGTQGLSIGDNRSKKPKMLKNHHFEKQKTLKEEYMRIDFKRKSFKANVQVYGFKSGDHQIAYIPYLNLTAYGATEDEAIEMLFEDCVEDMLNNLMELPEHEVTTELGKYGWKRSSYQKKQFKLKSYIDADGVLKNFNLPKETKISRQFIVA